MVGGFGGIDFITVRGNVVVGTGSTESCSFTKGESTCGGLSSGSCPSAGLIGCCSTTEGSVSSGECYYNSTEATPAKSACTGSGESWTTSAP